MDIVSICLFFIILTGWTLTTYFAKKDSQNFIREEVKNLFDIAHAKLEMKKIGVKKIDIGLKGGRVEFYPETSVSPENLLALLQSSDDYRMKDAQTLAISKMLSGRDERFQEIASISEKLGCK